MAYTKLFNEILASTIWDEEMYVKVVWITMLAMRNERNEVMASIPGVAHMARVSLEQCKKAIEKFSSPDSFSRSQEHEGRRIQPVDGGWVLLNGEKYRRKQTEDERRAYMRNYMQNYRNETSSGQDVNPMLTNVSNVKDVNVVEKSRVEKSREKNTLSIKDGALRDQKFLEFWKSYPKKTGKLGCLRIWDRMKLDSKLPQILSALESQKESHKWREESGRFIPNPATWLNQGRWDDEVSTNQTTSSVDWDRVKRELESEGKL